MYRNQPSRIHQIHNRSQAQQQRRRHHYKRAVTCCSCISRTSRCNPACLAIGKYLQPMPATGIVWSLWPATTPSWKPSALLRLAPTLNGHGPRQPQRREMGTTPATISISSKARSSTIYPSQMRPWWRRYLEKGFDYQTNFASHNNGYAFRLTTNNKSTIVYVCMYVNLLQLF